MKKAIIGVVSSVSSAVVLAAPADTTAVTTAIADAGTAAGVVGMAVLVMTVGVRVYKWIKTAL